MNPFLPTRATSCLTLLCILVTWTTGANPVQAQEPVGVIILARGTATAIDSLGNSRQLKRRDPVYTGDTMVTENDADLQVRMLDDAQYALRGPARLEFSSYSFDGDDNTPDTALLRLAEGCLQSISGRIGDQDHDVFRIETPAADIGLNGTVYTACFEGTVLTTAVRQGGIVVSNEYGSITLGINSGFDYSQSASGNAPEGVLIEPAPIRNIGRSQNLSPALQTPAPAQLFNPPTQPATPSPLLPQQDYGIIQ